jgi:hypothetical protein
MGGAPATAQLNQTAHRDGWILAAVRAPGQHGAIWRTDLWIATNAELTPVSEIQIYFYPADTDNTDVEPLTVPTHMGQNVYFVEDVVSYYLQPSEPWLGAIRYVAPVDVQVWARVYSISADGSASYGQMIEGIPHKDMSADSEPWDPLEHQRIYAMRHTPDRRYRVNVGVVNPTEVESTYHLEMFDNSFEERYHHVWVTVPPLSMTQLNGAFVGANGGDFSDAILRVICTTENGGAFAYASVVDNATNDAFFVRGVKPRKIDPTKRGVELTAGSAPSR